MQLSEYDNWLLEKKREKVIQIVSVAADALKIPRPYINFSGCSLEKANELAHYHPNENKICVSEIQLKKQNFQGLIDTAVHEVTHFFVLGHGAEFQRVKNYIRGAVWNPNEAVVMANPNPDNDKKPSNTSKDGIIKSDKEQDRRLLLQTLENATSNEERKHLVEMITKIDEKNSRPQKKKEKNTDKIKAQQKPKANAKTAAAGIFSSEVCQMPGCNDKASTTCKYCNKEFCKDHLSARLVISAQEMWNLNNIRESDPEKYAKFTQDWNKSDGHPCPVYTADWSKNHSAEIARSAYKQYNFPSFKSIKGNKIFYSSPGRTYNGTRPYTNVKQHKNKRKAVIIIIGLIILVLISIGLVYAANHNLFDLGVIANQNNTYSTILPQGSGSSPIQNSSPPSIGNLAFCINRGIFRTSDYRGLNSSQIQQLVIYCEFYNYKPGIVNGTNETAICKGVYLCQLG